MYSNPSKPGQVRCCDRRFGPTSRALRAAYVPCHAPMSATRAPVRCAGWACVHQCFDANRPWSREELTLKGSIRGRAGACNMHHCGALSRNAPRPQATLTPCADACSPMPPCRDRRPLGRALEGAGWARCALPSPPPARRTTTAPPARVRGRCRKCRGVSVPSEAAL